MKAWWRKVALVAGSAVPLAAAAVLRYFAVDLSALFATILGIAAGGLLLAAALKRIGETLEQSRSTIRLLRKIERASAATGTRNLEEIRRLNREMEVQHGQIDLVSNSVKEGIAHNERLLSSLRSRLDNIEAESKRQSRRTGEALREMEFRYTHQLQSNSIQETEALLRLRDEYPLRFESPLLWNYAMSPRGMWQVMNLVREKQPSVVVELGSGLSTLYLSRCIAESHDLSIYSLEHSLEYLEATRRLLNEHESTDGVHLVHAPLVDTDVGGQSFSWYRMPDGLPAQIDLLVVDGPPGRTGPMARLPAVECLFERLRPGCLIVLDDAHRDDEREIARSWVRDFSLRRRHSSTPRQVVLERPA